MSGNNVPNKAAAFATPAPSATRASDIETLGKFMWGGWLVYVAIAGWNINIPVTVMAGISEIWHGQSRTAAGWTIIVGIVLFVAWVVMMAVASHLDRKSPRAAPVLNPNRPATITPVQKAADQKAAAPKPPATPIAQAVKRVEVAPTPAKSPSEQAAIDMLKKMIAEKGLIVINDTTQAERLIRERCLGVKAKTSIEVKKEANVLVIALHEGLPQRLLANGVTLSPTAIGNHVAALSQASGLDSRSAQFAVEAWVKALELRPAQTDGVMDHATRKA